MYVYAYWNWYKCGCIKTPHRFFCASIPLFCSCACVCVCVYVCAYVPIHMGAETFICVWVRICNYIQMYMWCVHVDFFLLLFVNKGIWDMCMSRLYEDGYIAKPRRKCGASWSHHTAPIATTCNTLQHTATHGNSRQLAATHCNTLQHNAMHCSTLQ